MYHAQIVVCFISEVGTYQERGSVCYVTRYQEYIQRILLTWQHGGHLIVTFEILCIRIYDDQVENPTHEAYIYHASSS